MGRLQMELSTRQASVFALTLRQLDLLWAICCGASLTIKLEGDLGAECRQELGRRRTCPPLTKPVSEIWEVGRAQVAAANRIWDSLQSPDPTEVQGYASDILMSHISHHN